MEFKEAYQLMLEGKSIRRPTWIGYWFMRDGVIWLKCKNGSIMDIRETTDVRYTFDNIVSSDWEEAEEGVSYGNETIRQLETIQKQQKLNNVFSVDEEGPGGAHHRYHIETNEETPKHIAVIQFQKGPRSEPGSIKGVLGVDLLEIVRDTLICFQNGPFACDYNAEALEGVEKALNALNRRVEDRINRGVLGHNKQ